MNKVNKRPKVMRTLLLIVPKQTYTPVHVLQHTWVDIDAACTVLPTCQVT